MTFVPFIMLIHSAFQRSPVPFMLLAFGVAAWLVTFSCAIFMLPLGVLYFAGCGQVDDGEGIRGSGSREPKKSPASAKGKAEILSASMNG